MDRNEEAVRALAYRLWERRGRPDGGAEQDWFEAERQLSGAQASPSATEEASAGQADPEAPAGTLDEWPVTSAPPTGAAPRRSRKNRTAKTPSSRTPETTPRHVAADEALGKDTSD